MSSVLNPTAVFLQSWVCATECGSRERYEGLEIGSKSHMQWIQCLAAHASAASRDLTVVLILNTHLALFLLSYHNHRHLKPQLRFQTAVGLWTACSASHYAYTFPLLWFSYRKQRRLNIFPLLCSTSSHRISISLDCMVFDFKNCCLHCWFELHKNPYKDSGLRRRQNFQQFLKWHST